MQVSYNIEFKDLNTGNTWRPREFQKRAMNVFRKCNVMFLAIPRQHGKSNLCCLLLHDFLFNYTKRKHPEALVVAQKFESVNKFYYSQLLKQLEHLPQELISLEYSRAKEKASIVIKRPWLEDTATITFASASSENVANSFRGNTEDFLILDEYAFYHGIGLWGKVFRSMTDDTDGKAVITSTVNGPNDFMEIDLRFYKGWVRQDGHHGWVKENIYETGLRNLDWIENLKTSISKEQFEQEYMHNYYAGAMGEYPIGQELADRKLTPVLFNPQNHTVTFSVDLGKPGNLATWAYIRKPTEDKYLMVHYKDDYKGWVDMLDDIFARFFEYKRIRIVLPHDANHAAYKEGRTHAQEMMDYVYKKGYNIKIEIPEPLQRPQNKLALWRETVWKTHSFDFLEDDEVAKGFDLLRKFKFAKNSKTGVIEFSKIEKNGAEHCADAFAYAVETLKEADNITKYDGFTIPQTRRIVNELKKKTGSADGYTKNKKEY